MYVGQVALLLTYDAICDTLQLFAERGHCVDRCPFGEHWENMTVVSKKQKLCNGPKRINKRIDKVHVQQTQQVILVEISEKKPMITLTAVSDVQ